MRRIFSPIGFAACLSAIAWVTTLGASPASAALIGFDDLLGGGVEAAAIASPYAGFIWNNFDALDTVLYTADMGPNGYANGVLSPRNVAYDGYGNAASFSAGQSFLLSSYAIGAAWNNDMTITVQGWRNGTLVDSDSFAVSADGSVRRQAGWTNIDTVTFIASGGTSAGYRGLGTEFYLDDIAINESVVFGDIPIPEPSAIVLLIPAAAATAALRRRRKRA